MQARKDKYKDNPILAEGLDLVEEDQISHEIQLEEDLKVEEGLSMYPICYTSILQVQPDLPWKCGKCKAIKADILGEASSDDESGSEESDSEDDDEGMPVRLIPYLVPY